MVEPNGVELTVCVFLNHLCLNVLYGRVELALRVLNAFFETSVFSLFNNPTRFAGKRVFKIDFFGFCTCRYTDRKITDLHRESIDDIVIPSKVKKKFNLHTRKTSICIVFTVIFTIIFTLLFHP